MWYAVTSVGGIILAVYGSALRDEAEKKAGEIAAKTGFAAFVVTVKGHRPFVGGTYAA